MNWINVKDQPAPENRPIQAVYVEKRYENQKRIGTVFWDDCCRRWKERCGCSGVDCEEAEIKILYWAELPELPKD